MRAESIVFTRAKGVTIAASTEYNIDTEFLRPIQLLQNSNETDANVTFNDGVAFVVRAGETIVFSVPISGTITSDVELTALT